MFTRTRLSLLMNYGLQESFQAIQPLAWYNCELNGVDRKWRHIKANEQNMRVEALFNEGVL